MAQIILIENNKNLHDLISLNLSNYLGAEVIPRENADEAIELMSILPSISLVICRTVVESEPTAKKIMEFLKENQRNSTTAIILGDVTDELKSDPGFNDRAIVITDPKKWEDIIQSSARALGINEEVLSKKPTPDYVPIPIHYFLPLKNSCCNIFIRIKKSAQEFQYVKRIHQDDAFTKEDINRYIEQGLEFLYIPKEYQKNFTNFLSNQLVEALENSDGPLEESLEVLSEAYDVATKEILRVGFTSATTQLVDIILDSMLSTIEQSAGPNSLLKKIINAKTGPLYEASHMTAVLVSKCLNLLGVTDPCVHEKVTYASFLHDICFVDNSDLALISSEEELKAANLNESETKLVLGHAARAADLVAKIPSPPKGLEELIRLHHGNSKGQGFNLSEPSEIPGQAKIFLVAREFVRELQRHKREGGQAIPIVETLYNKYSDPEMIKVIKAIEKTLGNNKA